ncbi:MAG: hypothetical protein ABI895_20865 [Deltaproteobacteria bacterium]
MSTDDPDIESSNPSKNYKVGDFDQLSGFFTPVWESKRRIRSEPPAPPSSKGGSNRPEPSSKSAPPGAASTPDAPLSAEEPANTKTSKDAGVPRPRASSGSPTAGRVGGRSSAVQAPTPVPPAPSSERSSAPGELAGSRSVLLPPAVAEVFSAPVVDDADGASPPAGPTASPRREEAATDPQRHAEPASASPSAAARALRDAGPDLPPAAFLDQEPEFRSRAGVPRTGVPRPERSDRPAAQYRAQLVSSAAARVHEQLKAKLQAEAAEIDESRFDRDPETHRDLLLGEPAEYDPYPLSLMRRLRRTIRLSTPVPDPVRSLVSKYDRG